MDRFNDKQLEIIRTDKSKVLVEAAAASGKTKCLVARIEYLISSGVDPHKIVAITFTNNAASEMYERLGQPDGLFIGTVHSYCNYLLRVGGISTSKILDDEQFDKLFLVFKKNLQCVREIEHLIVDEAQDSTDLQFEFFELLKPKNFMYFYDHRQSIYGFAKANPKYLVKDLRYRNDITVYTMNQNYRNGTAILNHAKKIINDFRMDEEYYDGSIPMRHIQGKFSTGSMSLEGIANTIKKDGKFGEWFVLTRANRDVNAICKNFEKNGVPYDTFKQADLNNEEIAQKMKEDTVKVLTIHSSKGLEANKVLVYAPVIYDEESRRLFYVAATRARDVLLWISPAKEVKKKKKVKTENWEF